MEYYPVQVKSLVKTTIFISVYILELDLKRNQEMTFLKEHALSLWRQAEKLLELASLSDSIGEALEAEAYYLEICQKMINKKTRQNTYLSSSLLSQCVIALPVIALSMSIISQQCHQLPSFAKRNIQKSKRNVNPFLYAMH